MIQNKNVEKVLVITASPLKDNMSGPALRALEIAKVLSTKFEIKLVSTSENSLSNQLFDIYFCDEDQLKQLAEEADAIIFQGYTQSEFPWLASLDALLISDLYAPFQLEHLEDIKIDIGPNSAREFSQSLSALTEQMRSADFFICASERQRLYWLGHLFAAGRVSPIVYAADPTLRSLIDLVPFGIEPKFPNENHGLVRNASTGITNDDFVLFWGGGIYNWFDPSTLIKAVARLSVDFPHLKLFFLAGTHPDSSVEIPIRVKEAISTASELGVLGKSIIFHNEWVKFDERSQFLSEVDMGAVTHFDSLETELSYRTRLLDCIWAELPMLSTGGDVIAELIQSQDLGIVVESSNQESIEQALIKILTNTSQMERFSLNIAKIRSDYFWEETTKPLVAYLSRGKYLRSKDSRLPVVPIRYHQRSWILKRISGLKARFIEGGYSAVFERILKKIKIGSRKDE